MERDRVRQLAFCIACAFFVFFGTSVIGYAEGLQELLPGVVKVIAKPPAGGEKAGSGFIIQYTSKELFILTAAHVVQGDKYQQLNFLEGKGKRSKRKFKRDPKWVMMKVGWPY